MGRFIQKRAFFTRRTVICASSKFPVRNRHELCVWMNRFLQVVSISALAVAVRIRETLSKSFITISRFRLSLLFSKDSQPSFNRHLYLGVLYTGTLRNCFSSGQVLEGNERQRLMNQTVGDVADVKTIQCEQRMWTRWNS